MTDSYILRNLIKEKGFKLKYIAQKMGITYYTLQRKINNEVTFNSEEILKLCDILNLKDLKKREKIFFKRWVDFKTTKVWKFMVKNENYLVGKRIKSFKGKLTNKKVSESFIKIHLNFVIDKNIFK